MKLTDLLDLDYGDYETPDKMVMVMLRNMAYELDCIEAKNARLVKELKEAAAVLSVLQSYIKIEDFGSGKVIRFTSLYPEDIGQEEVLAWAKKINAEEIKIEE